MFKRIVKYIGIGTTLLLLAFGVVLAVKMHQYGEDMDKKMQAATRQQDEEFAIGNLGGVMAKIPIKCVSDGFVQYDVPGHTEGGVSGQNELSGMRSFRSFGIEVRLPDLVCMENEALRLDRKEQFLQPDNPWLDITLISGQNYPSTGIMMAEMLARPVKKSVIHPTKFWFDNYEKLPEDVHGLKAYVVTGLNPHTGRPARESEDDIYIHESEQGIADTYIECRKSNVTPGEVSGCRIMYVMEPVAKVQVSVHFTGSRLPQWRHIREVSFNLLRGYLAER